MTPLGLRHFALVAVFVATATAAFAQTHVTVMQLLQNPRVYAGQRVTVSGYYASDWEGHILFADRLERNQSIARSLFVYNEPNIESFLRPAQAIGVFVYDSEATGQILGGGYGPYGGWKAALINATVHLGPKLNEPNRVTSHEALAIATRAIRRDHLPLPVGYTTRIEAGSENGAPVWKVYFYRAKPEHGRRRMYDLAVDRRSGYVQAFNDVRATGGRDDPPLPGYEKQKAPNQARGCVITKAGAGAKAASAE